MIVAFTAITLPLDQMTKLQSTHQFLRFEDISDTTIYQGRRQELFAFGSDQIWLSVSQTYVRNHGASWGVWAEMHDDWRSPIILMMGLVATMLLFAVAIRLLSTGYERSAYAICGLIAGSFGNLLDRVRLGYVVDFLSLKAGWGDSKAQLPSFNIADIIIVFSLIWLITTILKSSAASASKD